MKLVIYGCRQVTINNELRPLNVDEKVWVYKMLNSYNKADIVTEVVSGGAKGVDRLGEIWAKVNNIPITQFIPDWNKHGKKAAVLRNMEMADYADFGIGFWDGVSRGTKHMIDYMTEIGKPNIVERFDSPF